MACALSRRRKWTVRGHDFELPPLRMAAVQLVVAATNWLLIGAIVWTLLQFRVDYTKTLTVLLVAAVAGVITHVPAGVGVLEAVFVSLLGSDLPKNEILGALLAYRAVYYLGPLVVATIAYVAFEGRIGAAKALPPPASAASGRYQAVVRPSSRPAPGPSLRARGAPPRSAGRVLPGSPDEPRPGPVADRRSRSGSCPRSLRGTSPGPRR